jgi:hypothetical protein
MAGSPVMIMVGDASQVELKMDLLLRGSTCHLHQPDNAGVGEAAADLCLEAWG